MTHYTYWDVPERPLDPPEYELPICPVCRTECDTFYIDDGGGIIGCENCVEIRSAEEYVQEQKERYCEAEIDRKIDERLVQ